MPNAAKTNAAMPNAAMPNATTAFWTSFEERTAPYNLLTHPFYQAWSRGDLTRDDLREYASAPPTNRVPHSCAA